MVDNITIDLLEVILVSLVHVMFDIKFTFNTISFHVFSSSLRLNLNSPVKYVVKPIF